MLTKISRKLFIFVSLFTSFVILRAEVINKSILPQLFEGRSYYHLKKDVICKSNDPDRTVIKSWANKISFKDGQLLIWGNLCKDSPELISFSDTKKDLFLSSDMQIIIYKKEVLVFYKFEPKLCLAGQWCPVVR